MEPEMMFWITMDCSGANGPLTDGVGTAETGGPFTVTGTDVVTYSVD